HHPEPAEAAQRAQSAADAGARCRALCLRRERRRRRDRHHRQRQGVRRRCRHRRDEGLQLHGRLHGRLHHARLGAHPAHPQAGDRGGGRLCARRRQRARHDVRHRHRCRERALRPAGGESRRHAGRRRHAAPAARRRQGEGDGPLPDRAHDGRAGSRARRPRLARRAARQADGGGDGGGRENRRLLGPGGDDDQGIDQPRLRDAARRGRAVRAPRVPLAVRARGPEGGHGRVSREKKAHLQESIELVERIWLKSYPPGVPAEINPNEYRSLVELFETSIRNYGARAAFNNMGRTISFAELDTMSRDFGAWLQARGLVRGARVALMMPNCLQYPVAMFGALRAGATVVNVNPLYTARELEYQLRDCGAEAIVILENFAHVLQEVLPRTPLRHIVVSSLGELLGLKGLIVNLVVRKLKKRVPPYELPGAVSFKRALAEGARGRLDTPPLGHDDIAFLQYTGGTTGVSKGAMLLHRNVIAALLQYKAWLAPLMGEERAVVITALPLYHIFSLTVNCLVMMVVGGENVLITNPRDIAGFVKELAKHRYSMISGVNTLFNALLNHADFARLDFSGLKLAVGGGMAVQKAVAERWKQVTGTPIIEGYGLTETAPSATANPLN